ncbi:MAG: ABC transporter ATP-binding protein [Acidimicrobiaceae bacterium]|nr:ABC transporter ATP-binding protein [Acidimicrobiaceae bacterium]MYG56214.1 ABC transporter ATP-binding protein [Acidimicrobiaceae bacterium]MYJ98428.1 ABC transporter ATP-binding protein [Acidimicrobiaceae bacterium]
MTTAIRVRGLTKSYGDLRAVDGVSFDVVEGEVLAILGPNGAGKTTTVEILEGHRTRDGGDVSVLGTDPGRGGRPFRDRIGIVLQAAGVDRELSTREALELYGAAYSTPRSIDELIELVELTDKADDRIVSLSGGQRRRVDLALGLIGNPELIFLDEPTTGFDPRARRRSWDVISNLTSLGRTIVLTTHYLDEAEYLADRVAVMAKGRIVADGTPAELRRSVQSDTKIAFDLPRLDEPLVELFDPLIGQGRGRGHRVEFLTPAPTADLAHVTSWAMQRGIELDGLTVESADLEDVYLSLVGEDEDSEDSGRADG